MFAIKTFSSSDHKKVIFFLSITTILSIVVYWKTIVFNRILAKIFNESFSFPIKRLSFFSAFSKYCKENFVG